MTLDQLRVLDAIERSGSFTAAARDLRRATSALSYSVRTLEDSLGVELFDRSKHRASMTEAGRMILSEARGVLERANALERSATRLREGWEPRLDFVLDGLVPLTPIIRAVQRFTELGAGTRLELNVELFGGVAERFERTEADLMLSLGLEEDPSLRTVPLPPLEMLLVARTDHPLCVELRRVHREDLERHVELRVRDSSRADVPRTGGLSPHAFTFSDVRALREAILGGLGFGWIPRHLVQGALNEKRVAVVLFEEGFRRRFTPRLAHRKGRPPGRAASAFIEAVLEEVENMMGRSRRGL